jgi:cobalt-zinc-cadmium efflux system membrane fusion protein
MSAPSILLVDDDEVLSQVLRRVLSRQGYEVREASNVSQALQLAREQRPRLGLLDLCLPDGDGTDLARQLKAEAGNFPLILMTAYPLRLREQPQLSEGFTRVLTKPLNLQELRQAIDAALTTPPGNESATPARRPETASSHPEPAAATAPAAEARPTPRRSSRRKIAILAGLVILLALIVGAAVLPTLGITGLPNLLAGKQANKEVLSTGQPAPVAVEAVPGNPNALRVPADVHRTLGIQTAVVDRARTPHPLELAGSLAFNPDRLARIHTRFPGEVVEIGPYEGPGDGLASHRPLRFGDPVKENQLLAVVWSRDLGEKKSELVDALSQLKVDQESLDKLEALYEKGGVPEATVRQWRRNVESDRNAINRAERTLRIWKLTDKEIQEIYDEADRIRQRGGRRDREKEKGWARVEVRAPFAGTIVEKNVTENEIVDTSADLFKIANLDRLTVWAHAYEEDLPALRHLQTPIEWTIAFKGDPEAKPVSGRLVEVGNVIDPAQHTALVMGWVDNPQRTLRAGQFITATINVPPPNDVVALPVGAVVEDGRDSIVFVQPDPTKPVYVMRRVAVTARFADATYVRSEPTYFGPVAAAAVGPFALRSPVTLAVRPGERVVTRSVLEMQAALDDLQTKSKNDKEEK